MFLFFLWEGRGGAWRALALRNTKRKAVPPKQIRKGAIQKQKIYPDRGRGTGAHWHGHR